MNGLKSPDFTEANRFERKTMLSGIFAAESVKMPGDRFLAYCNLPEVCV